LAESQASDQVIQSIAGHMSRRMLDHYSHIRMDAKRTVVDSLVEEGIGSNPNPKSRQRSVTSQKASSKNQPLRNLLKPKWARPGSNRWPLPCQFCLLTVT